MSSVSEWSAVEDGNTHLDQYDLQQRINPHSPLNRYTKKIMAAVKAKADETDSRIDQIVEPREVSLSGDATGSGVFDEGGACAVSVSIDDATAGSSGFMSAADKATLDGLEATRFSGPDVAQAQAIHVDAANGSDDNDGKTAATAVRTLERAYALWNAANSPQPTIYLHGSHVYETPAVAADAAAGRTEGLYLYAGGAPHIIGVEDTLGAGVPTLKFIFCVTGTTPETVDRTSRHYVYGYNTQSTGPRFYTCHPHFSNLIIDSNVNGMYFEGCSISFENTEFKIPCRIISSSGSIENCSFFAEVVDVDGTSYNPFGLSVCASLYCYTSAVKISNPTFNVEDGKSVACGIYTRSSVRVDGTVTIKGQSIANGGSCVLGVDSSFVHVSTGTISGTSTNWQYGLYLAGCADVRFNSDEFYTAWTAIGSGIYDTGNSLIRVSESIIVHGRAAIRNATLSGAVSFYNGSSAGDGGGIWLYGKNNSSADKAGTVRLQASDGTNYRALDCKSDGTLTWMGQPIQGESDERVKTPMSSVPDDVLDAWEDVQWGQFQYLDAVARKGESARQHLGLIAQRVKAVFEERGLDACSYGILCHEEREASEDGTPAIDMWMVRYTEALAMEAACLRRRIARLEAQVYGND